jgi:FixJ family two-component response regulator
MTRCGKGVLKKEECMICIVDDDVSLCRALTRLLRSTGFTNVSTFSSAEEFIQADRGETCSILILDLQLPGMSGVELLHLLRTSGRSTPIILISAHDEELKRARETNHGWAAFLHKPFEEKELSSVISSLTAS